jgi:flagellar hook protein FlgE
MMRSLWSGVSGLQAHQIAMDVEGNNIANVNTIGFKYSRANFSDMLSQTSKIATAPQDSSGGKNPQQVGLGTQINSITRMFAQGSVQTTGKNTDLAIQGNGFFVLSGDGGRTYKYTRNGDFLFDANGNFVNNQGLIAQGWTRDKKTGQIDNTAPIRDIVIPPGLTTPANPTSKLSLKANLNSGESIKVKSPIRPLDSTDGLAGGKDPEKVDDFNVLFDAEGNSFNIKPGQGVEMSFDGGNTIRRFRYEPVSTNIDLTAASGEYKFRTTEDLRAAIQHFARQTSPTAEVIINEQGKYEIRNSVGAAGGGVDLNIQVKAIEDATTDKNELFETTMKSFSGQLTAGTNAIKITQTINAATNAASIDIFDSLGTKHTVRIEFRKQGYVYDTNGIKTGSQWDMKISVPEPGEIGGFIKPNEVEGQIIFNSDGSLASYTPASITYTANNGSAPNQTIQLDFGSANKFDGITSFDRESANSGRNQDGYAGGDLNGIRIDSSGTLIGSFTNGRSVALAQVAMAKFTNDIGLESDGGDVFIQTANSGDPVIGQADQGGRGFIQSSALEMSNVDLSRSLTQLIVVQRGFQANSKTITTSDQMLNTLLQLKQ